MATVDLPEPVQADERGNASSFPLATGVRLRLDGHSPRT